MLHLTSSSFTASNEQIYSVLVDYLALPAMSYWSTIDGHSFHKQDGWEVNSDMNILNQRVDKLSNGDVTVVVVWESFNSKDIESIEVIFHKSSYIHMHKNITADLYYLDDELQDHEQNVVEILSENIIGFVAEKLHDTSDSMLKQRYKALLEKLNNHYFSLPGLEALAQKFGI